MHPALYLCFLVCWSPLHSSSRDMHIHTCLPTYLLILYYVRFSYRSTKTRYSSLSVALCSAYEGNLVCGQMFRLVSLWEDDLKLMSGAGGWRMHRGATSRCARNQACTVHTYFCLHDTPLGSCCDLTMVLLP